MWSNQENRVRKQVKNPCEAYKIKASQNLHKIISTHLLTVLIISAILQLEQRKRKKFRTSFVPVTEQHQDLFQSAYRQCTRDRFPSCTLTTLFSIVIRKGDMTYVNA